MTQEEKAERYDEALKRAKIAYKDEDRHLKATLGRIFPELKEDKGEKIRKAIIDVIKSLKEQQCHHIYGVIYDEMIDWLEKQGRHANFRNKIRIGDKVTRNEDGVLVNLSQLNMVAKPTEEYNITGIGSKHAQGKLGEMIKKLILDKQSEQKQDPCDNCKDAMLNCHNFPCVKKKAFEQGKSVFEVIKEEPQVYKTEDGEIITYSENDGYKVEQKPQGKTALEAIKEEKVDNANKVEPKDYNNIDPHFGKPIDKVEPKFHEGQWVVWQDKYYKVNYNGCGYELTDQNGESMSLEYGAVDKTASLWRIQDAKAGDVLYSPKESVVESIVLIGGWKQLDGDSSLCAAITYRVKENEIEDEYPGAIWWSGKINSFYPATKLQRDILFQKMKEAGFEWDAKLKQLGKIEDEIEIPYGAKDSELQEATYYIPKGFHAEIDDDKVVIKKGEKPTWSEMDKAITRAILSNLESLKNRGDREFSEAAYQSEIKWLKALKRRVGYDEEWSEEDETALGDALCAIEQAKTVAKNENDMGNIWYAEKWLKSLKYRMHPKNGYNPYKEVVESIAKMCEKYDKYSHSILKDFYNNVKVKCKDAKEFDSLHPQNTNVKKS